MHLLRKHPFTRPEWRLLLWPPSVALLAAALEAELGRDGESTSGPALEGLVKQAGTKAGRTRLEVVQSVLRDLAVAPALQRRLAELLGAP